MLFLRSFPGAFQKDERFKNKNKFKKQAKKKHENEVILEKKCLIFSFPDFSWIPFMVNVPEDLRNNISTESHKIMNSSLVLVYNLFDQ